MVRTYSPTIIRSSGATVSIMALGAIGETRPKLIGLFIFVGRVQPGSNHRDLLFAAEKYHLQVPTVQYGRYGTNLLYTKAVLYLHKVVTDRVVCTSCINLVHSNF